MRKNNPDRGSYNRFLTEAIQNKPTADLNSVVIGWDISKFEFAYPDNWQEEFSKFENTIEQNAFDHLLDSLKTTSYYNPQPKGFFIVLLGIAVLILVFITFMSLFQKLMFS